MEFTGREFVLRETMTNADRRYSCSIAVHHQLRTFSLLDVLDSIITDVHWVGPAGGLPPKRLAMLSQIRPAVARPSILGAMSVALSATTAHVSGFAGPSLIPRVYSVALAMPTMNPMSSSHRCRSVILPPPKVRHAALGSEDRAVPRCASNRGNAQSLLCWHRVRPRSLPIGRRDLCRNCR